MTVVKTVAEATRLAAEAARADLVTGLVPTMGALHDGHRALIRRARDECGWVAVSIFVNPTQFAEGEDLGKYPRTFEKDLAACESEGADLVFAPAEGEMYLADHTTWVEVGELSVSMEGLSRPSHFRGVTTVVAKLLNVFRPARAYFGQKDLQQVVIVERMARDLNMPVEIIRVPTVREPDGLAMSSRNVYLSGPEREAALSLRRGLADFERMVAEGERDANVLMEAVAEPVIAEPLATLDYVSIVDARTLRDVSRVRGEVAAALAVWIGDTRLIDNAIVEVADPAEEK